MNQTDNNKPFRVQVGSLSGQTLRRASEAPNTTRLHFWSDPEQTNITRYSANQFNDPEKCAYNLAATLTGISLLSYGFGYETFETDGDNIMEKDHQMGDLLAIICHHWRGVTTQEEVNSPLGPEIIIPALAKDKEIDIKLQEIKSQKGTGILETFGDNQVFIENLTQDQVKEKFEADIAYKLSVHANSFLNNLISPDTMQPRVMYEQFSDEFSFVIVNTYVPTNKKTDSTDCAITVKLDGMFAATVAHGCGEDQQSTTSHHYCALITAAALDTVKRAILGNGLEGKDLQRYFFETIKLLDKEKAFPLDTESKRDVVFGGVVLYFDQEGKRKRFVYGLGNIAVAMRTNSQLVATLHLQGFVVDDNINDEKNGYFVPTLKGQQCADMVTAQVSDIANVTESIQIMTGCEKAFYAQKDKDKNLDQKGLECKQNLPVHQEFNGQGFNYKFNDTDDDLLHLSIDVQEAFIQMRNLPDSFTFK
jgi:hypothetical protein